MSSKQLKKLEEIKQKVSNLSEEEYDNKTISEIIKEINQLYIELSKISHNYDLTGIKELENKLLMSLKVNDAGFISYDYNAKDILRENISSAKIIVNQL